MAGSLPQVLGGLLAPAGLQPVRREVVVQLGVPGELILAHRPVV